MDLERGRIQPQGPHRALETCRQTSPGVSRGSMWLGLHRPLVITHWGKTLPTAKVESLGAEEGAGASQSSNPRGQQLLPSCPIAARQEGVSSSCCTSQTPRTASVSWGAPGPGTQLPWTTPPGPACTHRLPWVAARCLRSSTCTLHLCPVPLGSCAGVPRVLAFLYLVFFPWKDFF